MSGQLTLPMLGLLLVCVLLETARELCFKHAADGETVRAALFKPWTLIGIVIWVAEITATIIVFEHVALAIAFPMIALVYVVTVLGGAFILKEKINAYRMAGAVLITIGVACVGVAGL